MRWIVTFCWIVLSTYHATQARIIQLVTGMAICNMPFFEFLTLIHWIVTYPVYSVTQPLNNWSLFTWVVFITTNLWS